MGGGGRGGRGGDDRDGDEDRSRSGFGRWSTDFLGAGEKADRPGGKEAEGGDAD